MTEIFTRGDRVWFENVRGLHVTVIADYKHETLFADTNGRVFEAEVGEDSLFLSEKDGMFGKTVQVEQVHFE